MAAEEGEGQGGHGLVAVLQIRRANSKVLAKGGRKKNDFLGKMP